MSSGLLNQICERLPFWIGDENDPQRFAAFPQYLQGSSILNPVENFSEQEIFFSQMKLINNQFYFFLYFDIPFFI